MIEAQASKSEFRPTDRRRQLEGSGAFRRYVSNEGWTPAVNLYEDDAGCHVIVDLAGVAHEKIELSVVDDTLILRGHRAIPRPTASDSLASMHLMEIDHGAFCRQVQLPAPVEADGISAVYRTGLLWIHLPKSERS